ncbi:MAG: hypothetical protein IJ447_02445 [Clostridia bacterium]|nr:hypothetical protein [Clostridia bacterium]
MQKRRFEKVAVVLLSIVMLMTSTGIVSSLAVNVSESSAASVSTSTTSSTASSVTREGGSITSSSVAQEGGAVVTDNGDGTKENPYKITTAEEFLAIGNKVNNTASADKYFVLANDIDLSGVTAKDFEGGSLVGTDKTLSATSANVFIVLDGNGYSLKGLNVEFTKGTEASVFGVLNSKSVVKNIKIDRPVIKSTSDEMANLALVATENKGTISAVEIAYPVITAKAAVNTAFVVAVNEGTVSDVAVKGTHTNISAATADSHTISSVGTVGAVAALNHGTVANVSAINVGMFIPEAEGAVVFGGVVGANSGSVLASVSTGNVMGGKASDVVGGVVGKAVNPVGGEEATSTLTNNYTLVAISKSVYGCAVIGSAGTAEMIKDCYWSSAVSGKDVMATDFGAGVNEISSRFIIIPEGKTASLSATDVKSTVFGKAAVELDGEITVKGDGVKAQSADGKAEITAETAGKVAYATYTAKLTLPANVGSSKASNVLKQYQKVYLLTVAKDAEGDGTVENPFVIKSSADLAMYNYVPSMNAVLGGDIETGATVPAIKGTFDGNGYTISASKPLVANIYGTLKNVNVIVTADISSAVLGNAIGANVSGVAVSMADGVKLNVQANNRGILFNRIGGQSVIDDCHAQGEILICADKATAIGGFAGLVNGKATVTNSGAVTSITLGEGFTAEKTAGFVGSITADDVTISNCYTDGESEFIADMPEKIKLENIVTGWSFDGGNVGFFTGNGGEFTATLPAIKTFADSAAEDYKVICDGEKLVSSVSVADGKLTLKVERAQGVVTVKALPVTVVNKKTGLSATINVSNGLEKDAEGRYIISTAYDLAYMSENIAELANASFIMTADVDMSVVDGFAPVGGAEVAFSGIFDGSGKTVKNLTIDGTAKVGLFGVLDSATVKNVKLVNVNVTSTGGYAAVLAGQVTGNTVISGVTVEGAKVESHDLYTGVIVGAIDSELAPSITDITLKNNSVNSDSNYVGALAGRVNGNATVSGITVEEFTVSGASYVAGAVGLAQGDVSLADITVSGATVSGVSEVSGIASGNGNAAIKNSAVKASKISTIAITSANTAGGVSAVFSSAIENVSVENTTISAGVAGGIVGKTNADSTLTIKNASVKACNINSSDANTVAAGILGVHNVKGNVAIEAVLVDENTVISGAAVSAGLVGDCSGADSVLEVTDAKTLATVNGSMTANAIASAGALGRIGVSAVNNVSLKAVKVGGSVSGAAAVGGIVGIVKDGEAYKGIRAIVSDASVFAQMNVADASSAGVIFGEVEGNVINPEYTVLAVKNVVLTSYYGVNAYPTDAFAGGYTDLNDGIVPSVDTLETDEETTVKLYGLPTVDGYVFDSEAGWSSESADRVQVVSSSEKEVVLKAERRAQVSVVAYYVLESDPQVRVPVCFNIVSNVYEPLNGSGTQDDPYLVNNAYDLEAVSQYADKGAYFALTEDIVLTDADYEFGGAFYNLGNGIVSIGSLDKPFNGVFTGLYNGKVHSITGLKMSGGTFGGLFAVADGATVTDLVINGAEISATANAGILAGRASNSTFKNITVTASTVEATGFGCAVGGVVGYAEATTVESVTLNSVTVGTTAEATDATVEVAGGVAGIFDGVVKAVTLSGAVVTADDIGAGAVAVANSGTYISDTSLYVQVKASVAGGVIGEAKDTMFLSISGASVSGKVEGNSISAGIIAKVSSADEAKSFDKLKNSLISDTVVTAKVAGNGINAVAIGEVDERIAVDKENTTTNVFENVYYSSYQNSLGAFGTQEFNAYQNSEYEIIDLSAVYYSANGEVSDSVKLSTEFTALADDSIVISGADGTYKSFTAGGKNFELKDITSSPEGLVTYDAQNDAVKLNEVPAKPAKLVFVYNGGLEIAIDIEADYADATENAVNVSVQLVNATSDTELSDKLVGVMLKSKVDGEAKASDFFATADSQPASIGAVEVADGEIYVSMHLSEGCTFSVNALDENSNELLTEDAGNEGVLVTAGEAKSITLTVTIEDETDGAWGLRSLWTVIGK